MHARDAIKISLDMSDAVALPYLQDLTDQDLMQRPHPDCNHLNWQVGHLIAAENEMINAIFPGSMPPLPAGFAEKYSKDTHKSDDPKIFADKNTLLTAQREQRAGTLAALAKVT